MVEFDDGLAVAIRGAVQARREDAVSLLQELVRIPSVTGKEGAVGEVVGRAFSERGLVVDTWEATREETEPYRDHVGEQIYYEKVMFSCGNQVVNVFAMVYPVAERKRFDPVVERMEDQFHPGQRCP